MLSKHRYCLTADGEVVLDTDTRGMFLLVGQGCEISSEDIKRYGFVDGELPKQHISVESKEHDNFNVTSKEEGLNKSIDNKVAAKPSTTRTKRK